MSLGSLPCLSEKNPSGQSDDSGEKNTRISEKNTEKRKIQTRKRTEFRPKAQEKCSKIGHFAKSFGLFQGVQNERRR